MATYTILTSSVSDLDKALDSEKTRLEEKDKLITNAETTKNRIQTLNEIYLFN
jgi:hypothetical protein